MNGKDKKEGSTPRGRRGGSNNRRDPAEKLKAVKLHLEEGIPVPIVAKEIGAHPSAVYHWCNQYRDMGEEGLKGKRDGKGRKGKGATHNAIKERITSLKKENPELGIKKISQFLKRIFFLPASPETVRHTLHNAGLMQPVKKSKKNPQKPRFFERATPNQMWQSDIFTFRLLGANAYLIGFMDDYSRYMVGMGLYRSQTSEHVLEVYRKAAADYGVPKEQLTDNGRQYVSWRGKTRFQMELQKDKVHHIRSSPHHPQTLGKIERFWKTIWDDFLCRAQFENFESAQERVKFWLKYYNHMRPNQGIEGLCPADRFFEIRNEVKELMKKGIEENVLELALRGKPKDPFYMVGRLGDKSVVIHAEKGEIKMMLDGRASDKAITYDIEGGNERHGKEGQEGVQRAGEMPGGPVDVDAEQKAGINNKGIGDKLDVAEPLAAGRNAGNVNGAFAEVGIGGKELDTPAEITETAGDSAAQETDQAGEEAPEVAGGGQTAEGVNGPERESETEGGTDHQGSQRPDNCDAGRGEPEHKPEELLQVGGESAEGDDGRPGRPVFRSARLGCGQGEGDAQEEVA